MSAGTSLRSLIGLGATITLAGLIPGTSDGASSHAASGVLEGVVRLGGDALPGPTIIVNATDPDVCGDRQSLEDLLVSERERGVANVIVSVAGVPAGGDGDSPSHKPGSLVLDNVDCRFAPHVGVLVPGDSIVARNGDDVLHTVHYYGALERNLSLPRAGIRRSVTAERPGTIIVKCDVHGWMQAFIRVDPHPYHAVSRSDGSFRIEGIPAGEYTVELWHERLGALEKVVRIRAGETAILDAEYLLEPDP